MPGSAELAPVVPGRPILDWVLVPGWGFAGSVFSALRDALPPALRVEVTTCRDAGHLIDSRLAAVAAGRSPPFGICAWSLGAMLALDRAAGDPESVGALVILGGTPRFVASADWPCAMQTETFDAFAALAAQSPGRAQARLAGLSALGDAEAATVQRLLRAALDAPDPASPAGVTGTAALAGATAPETVPASAFADALRRGLELLRLTDLRPKLASVRVPVTLLHGVNDALVPVAAARIMARQLPSARLVEVPVAGHGFFMLRTRLVVDAMLGAGTIGAPGTTPVT